MAGPANQKKQRAKHRRWMTLGWRNDELMLKFLKKRGALDKFEGCYYDRGDPAKFLVPDIRALNRVNLVNPDNNIPLHTYDENALMVKHINARLKKCNPFRAHQAGNHFNEKKTSKASMEYKSRTPKFAKFFTNTQGQRMERNAEGQAASERFQNLLDHRDMVQDQIELEEQRMNEQQSHSNSNPNSNSNAKVSAKALFELKKQLTLMDREINELCSAPDVSALPPQLDRICDVLDSEDLTQEFREGANMPALKAQLEMEDELGDARINVRSMHGRKRKRALPTWSESDSPSTKKRKMEQVELLSKKRTQSAAQRKLTKLEEIKLKWQEALLVDHRKAGAASDAPWMRLIKSEMQVAAERHNQMVKIMESIGMASTRRTVEEEEEEKAELLDLPLEDPFLFLSDPDLSESEAELEAGMEVELDGDVESEQEVVDVDDDVDLDE